MVMEEIWIFFACDIAHKEAKKAKRGNVRKKKRYKNKRAGWLEERMRDKINDSVGFGLREVA